MEKNKIVFTGFPWLVPGAVKFLEAILEKRHFVLETGSGNSTIWLAEKVSKVISFEHSKKWHNHLAAYLGNHDIGNVDLYLDPGYPEKGIPRIGYLFDLILIDGRGRVKTFHSALPALKPGGYICIDNAERERYKPIFKALDSKGWPKAIFKEEWVTTFFQKP